MVKKIILDCDPGHDDALAMTLTVANPAIDLVAVTTRRRVTKPRIRP